MEVDFGDGSAGTEAVVHQKPFRPFSLDLVDGRTFSFDWIEGFLITSRTLHLADPEGNRVLIDLGLVSSVRFQDPPPASEAS